MSTVLALCLVGASGARTAGQLTIAAASDLQAVMPALAAEFERETGTSVRVTFGSSGNFFAQIRNGAPFDVFFSADLDYPRRLAADGFADPSSVYRYAVGRLALWTRTDSPADLTRGLAALAEPRIRRVAIANPEHAPYGRAAMAALRQAGVDQIVGPKLVLGENVTQAAQFVQSGNADAGLIALSVALAPAMASAGRYQEIPQRLHPPIEQGAAVLTTTRNKAAAAMFLDFMRRPSTTQQLRASGFAVP